MSFSNKLTLGHVESRREQARLQEELSMKEKLVRDTEIRNIQSADMKRAQELRVDEFSVQKLRERHETIPRLTSQSAVCTRANEFYGSDSGEFLRSGIESKWKIVLRFQSDCNDSKFTFLYAEPRQTLAI